MSMAQRWLSTQCGAEEWNQSSRKGGRWDNLNSQKVSKNAHSFQIGTLSCIACTLVILALLVLLHLQFQL